METGGSPHNRSSDRPSIRRFLPAKAICGWFPRPRIARFAPIRRRKPWRRPSSCTTPASIPWLRPRSTGCSPPRRCSITSTYYKGLVQLRLNQYPEAKRTLEALAGRKPVGAISLNTALALGETAEASGRLDDAIDIYRRIADDKRLVSDDVLSRLGAVALSAGDRKTAAAAYLRVYYEFPLTDAATAAASQLAALQDQISTQRLQAGSRPGARCSSGRAATPKRGRPSRSIQSLASGDDRELADLRVAECDFHLKRYAAARDGVRPYLERASRKAEARFFYLSGAARARQTRRVRRADAGARRRLPRQLLVGRGAEQSRHLLHRDERRRSGGAGLRRAVREVPDRPARRARRVEVRLVELPERRLRRDACGSFESAAARVSALGLPAVVSLLGGARARQARARRRRPSARLRLVYTDYGNSYYGRLARASARRAAPGSARRGSTPIAASLQPVARRRADAADRDERHPPAPRQRAVR